MLHIGLCWWFALVLLYLSIKLGWTLFHISAGLVLSAYSSLGGTAWLCHNVQGFPDPKSSLGCVLWAETSSPLCFTWVLQDSFLKCASNSYLPLLITKWENCDVNIWVVVHRNRAENNQREIKWGCLKKAELFSLMQTQFLKLMCWKVPGQSQMLRPGLRDLAAEWVRAASRDIWGWMLRGNWRITSCVGIVGGGNWGNFQEPQHPAPVSCTSLGHQAVLALQAAFLQWEELWLPSLWCICFCAMQGVEETNGQHWHCWDALSGFASDFIFLVACREITGCNYSKQWFLLKISVLSQLWGNTELKGRCFIFFLIYSFISLEEKQWTWCISSVPGVDAFHQRMVQMLFLTVTQRG